MKIFLFLYPIREYIESRQARWPRGKPFPIERLWEIIGARYRRNGFAVAWLLFGDKKNPGKPDLSRLYSPEIIKGGDITLSCGITFERHVSEKVYPSPKKILAKLGRPIEELALGGFHQDDCVTKVAQCAFRQSIHTFIDDDTTDMLFCRIALGTDIPLIRTDWSFESFGYTKERGFHGFLLRHIKRSYQKPWFRLH